MSHYYENSSDSIDPLRSQGSSEAPGHTERQYTQDVSVTVEREPGPPDPPFAVNEALETLLDDGAASIEAAKGFFAGSGSSL